MDMIIATQGKAALAAVIEHGSSGPVIHTPAISHVPVDFPNEGLNNLAKKINEIIDHLNK